jgi:hypothetical protein
MKLRTVLLMAFIAGAAQLPLRAAPPVIVEPGGVTVTTGVWTTVPDDYDGDYYIYNDRYYHGGKFERGDFVWEGRHYPDRYMHDGKWIYGGKWEHHSRKEARRERKHDL